MERKRKSIIITWKIENVKCIHQQKMELYSPEISMDEMDGTKWKLGVLEIAGSEISLCVKREEDNGLQEFGLFYHFSVKTPQGIFSTPKRIYGYIFKKNERCSMIRIDTKNLDDQKMDTILTLEDLTIHCKIWKQQGSFLKSVKFFAKTRLKIEHCMFDGNVRNFSSFPSEEMATLKTVSSSSGEKLVTVKFFFRNYSMGIIFEAMDKANKRFYHFKLHVLDCSGNKIDNVKLKRKFVLNSTERVYLPSLSVNELIKNKDQYLINDTLSMQCEITFYSGIECEQIEWAEYETDFTRAVESLTSKLGSPCDVKLQTDTETFPAHTAILSAHSPVFEAMFNTNIKETIKKCVHIDDIDAATVKRMLVFLYTDTLGELTWKKATKLYFSAVKYQILSLKEECTMRLKQSISVSNCCDLLLLADLYQDKYLKRAVRDFIAHHGEEVLFCEQWMDLEDSQPKVAIEILRDLFVEDCWIYIF
ncbi:speckle-type POZ protein-like [Argiope bruennichi]|uniref:speckle-type POZ protein-like n=1 Tax=Argiope bruennichi TaxID=94029 RepID=UPI002493E12F|nr:speckle-type POZ protein-like [Argiope bruennichi]XP_055942459.1 speckle-type POZ protein-like [Argiope bruennichi]XP_055942460.1 speckle-type POZ protein-like [Argiope bruennichi]